MPAETKFCLSCKGVIYGRSDKKFCDDHCRTSYNNQFKLSSQTIRNINGVLRRNRRILELLVPPDEYTMIVAAEKLLGQGFNFAYFTHTHADKTGASYFFCYEFGYRQLESSQFLLVRSLSN